jgi:hypothetical protein
MGENLKPSICAVTTFTDCPSKSYNFLKIHIYYKNRIVSFAPRGRPQINRKKQFAHFTVPVAAVSQIVISMWQTAHH